MPPDNDSEPLTTLHYMPGTCALGVHIALEWAGAPYEARRLSQEDLHSPDYLALNPAGVVPTLIQDGAVMTEASAILLALARQVPGLGPGPDAGEHDRFRFERLIIYLGGTLHPHFWPWFVPQRYGAAHEPDQANVKQAAEALIGRALTWLDGELGDGPFFLGARPSAVDAYFFPMGRWGYGLKTPTSEYPNLHGLMQRLAQDPGVAAAMTAQGLPPLSADT